MISKKKLAIILIILGVLGFIASEINKSSHRIYEKKYTQLGTYTEKIPLISGNTYVFTAYGADEEGALQTWASLNFSMLLTNLKGDVIAKEKIVSTSSNNKEGLRRTTNGFEKYYTAQYPDEFQFDLNFEEGDEVEIKVYENISDFEHLLPSLCIILALVSVVFYLRVRNK